MDPAIWAAIVGGLITGIPATWAVISSNKHARTSAKAAVDQAREQAVEETRLGRSAALAIELGRIRSDLRSSVDSINLDAVDDLRALMVRVASPVYTDDDRGAVLRLLQSRTAAQVTALQRYPGRQLPEVRVRPQIEEGP